MIQIDNRDRRGYRSELGQADTLTLEKGCCHFSTQGHKDFLNAITAYEPEAHGVAFKVSTFRGNRASVRIAFPEETVCTRSVHLHSCLHRQCYVFVHLRRY